MTPLDILSAPQVKEHGKLTILDTGEIIMLGDVALIVTQHSDNTRLKCYNCFFGEYNNWCGAPVNLICGERTLFKEMAIE